MKNYTITVNGTTYDVTVEETGSGAAPAAAAAPKAAPKPAAAAPAPAPKPAAAGAGSIRVEAGAAGKVFRIEKNVGDAVKKGEMERALSYLGFPYQITGVIVHGNKIGRTIGMPTINQLPDEEKLLPPYGVYYSEAEIEGHVFKGITNIGVKPTVTDENKVTVETFLYNFNQDVYGTRANVRLLGFLRPEMKFKGIDELKKQMKKDIEAGFRR